MSSMKLENDTWYMDTEHEQFVKMQELSSQGFQTKLWDLTETRGREYAVQFRPLRLKGTKWLSPSII